MTGRTHTVVVAGFGSQYRCDDGVGLVVAGRVAEQMPDAFDVGPVVDPLDLLGRWDGADLAVVVDAVRSGADPGTIRLVELAGGAPVDGTPDGGPTGGATSSHGIGLTGVLRLSRALERQPRRVVVVGIEGREFGDGTGLSGPVAGAVPGAVQLVARIIREDRGCA